MPRENKKIDSIKNKKIILIILEQCDEIEERCEGYRKEVRDTISDILAYERGHRVAATNIQKKINNKCNATARFLTTQRSQTTGTEELDS